MPLYTVPSTSQALSSAATKSLFLLNPVTNEFELTEFGVGFDASAAGQAVRVDLYRVTTLGSPAGTTVTPLKKKTVGSQSATTTALVNLSTEPTAVEVLKSWFLAPNGGQLVIQNPLGNETVAAAAGARIGLRAVTASGVTPNAIAYAEIRE